MSHYFFLGVELLGQPVGIIQIPIHVVKLPCRKFIPIILPLPGCKNACLQHANPEICLFLIVNSNKIINKYILLVLFEQNWLLRLNLFSNTISNSFFLTLFCHILLTCEIFFPYGFTFCICGHKSKSLGTRNSTRAKTIFFITI